MPKNRSEDLNNLLFETIEKLHDGDIEVDKAEAIVKVAQVIVNNTKNEIEFLKAVGGIGTGSGFFQPQHKSQTLLGE